MTLGWLQMPTRSLMLKATPMPQAMAMEFQILLVMLSPRSIQDTQPTSSRRFIEHFTTGLAGAPTSSDSARIPSYEAYKNAVGADSVWAPFQTRRGWEFAYWAKTRGITPSAVADLLAIDGVVERLELSYNSVKELNRIIDEELPGRPKFKCKNITIGGQAFEFYYRDVIPCIRALFGDAEFASDLILVPERHYAGKWRWSVQASLEARKPGATAIPVALSSDKTQLTLFRGKSAYPVCLTIGNIPKDTRRKPSRRAQILVGYIPMTRLQHIKSKSARRRALASMLHACMHRITDDMQLYGEMGVAMATGSGVWYRCHPILATYIGDYPEQVLVTGTYNGRCPKRMVPRDELERPTRYPPRTPDSVRDALLLADEDPSAFHAACGAAGIKPIYHPSWENLPFSDIFVSITPDILHQLHQGVIKHVLKWVSSPNAFGGNEIDARCRRMPLNHNARLFNTGVTIPPHVSGQGHKVRAMRGLLDFLYLAQPSVHTSETLHDLDDALDRFHDNKDIFKDLGIRENFNFPKPHSLLHYSSSIKLFGTTDNCSTEQSERLHIDFAKDAYRATNRKDEFIQMTAWL
ncbi:hypothetical protein BC834DRAFT_972717 [Gloeopeniophorella convolvens]|nr:hypothetical protein BC834DRAFT_972717 [Gloeopeniophorella convolvens]